MKTTYLNQIVRRICRIRVPIVYFLFSIGNIPINFHSRGPYHKISPEIRELFLNAISEGLDKRKAMSLFGLKRTTANSIIKCGGAFLSRGGRHNFKFTSEMDRFLQLHIGQNPFITLIKMQKKLLKRFNVNLHTSTISKQLKTMLYTTKTAKLVKENRNSESTKIIRKSYIEKYDDLIRRYHLIFTDEVNFNMWQHHTRGRAKKGNYYNLHLGKECIYKVTSQPGQGITAIAAISQTMGLVHYLCTNSSVNADTYKLFLDGLVSKLNSYETDLPFCIVHDNVPFHKFSEVITKFRSLNIEYRNTPPNSPFLNPIEYVFSKVKSKTKTFNENLSDKKILAHKLLKGFSSLVETRVDLMFGYIDKAFSEITVQNCNNWYNRVWKYKTACLEMKDIFCSKFDP